MGEETRMNATPGVGLVERARALAPLIAGEADEIERTRRLTPDVVAALIENGLYRALLPQSLGGAEVPIDAFMQMLEEIAKADASTAWCLGQCGVCAMIAASLDHDTAHEIFNTQPGILAWGAIAHEARAVEGGYRVTARWDFASGSRQASWLGAHVRIVGADGVPRKNADGSPEVRTILFPVTSAVLHDVWQAIGLAGTGTDSYEVSDLFIPERFTAFRDVPSALRERGPLYRIGTGSTFSLGFAAVSLGVARATLDAGIALARAKHQSLAASTMRDNQAVQGLIGRTEGDLRAARTYLYATASAMWRDLSATGEFSAAHRSAVRLAATWTIHQSARVVDAAYHMAGATAVFRSNPFERRFRDMHAIAQQIQARNAHYEDAGRAILDNNLDAPARIR